MKENLSGKIREIGTILFAIGCVGVVLLECVLLLTGLAALRTGLPGILLILAYLIGGIVTILWFYAFRLLMDGVAFIVEKMENWDPKGGTAAPAWLRKESSPVNAAAQPEKVPEAAVPGAEKAARPQIKTNAGEWNCPQCGYKNPAFRNSCANCYAKKQE